jgi:uncharacterized protein YkwD
MKKSKITALNAIAIAAALALSACGGGGGGGGGSSGAAASSTGASAPVGASSPTGSSATSANTTTPQYAANTAQQAIFNTLSQQRQQCGFPAFIENTQLDQAAQAHASYMGQNGGAITDTEVASNPGFTGATFSDRAVHFGFPNVAIGGGSAGYYTNATLSEAQYGQQIAYAWLSGVYHIGLAVWPATEIGVGWNETPFNGFPEIQAAISVSNFQPMAGSLPLTFPCQGTTGVAYKTLGETPTPPNTSGAWGTPVAVAGNVTDTIKLQSATMTDTSSNVITLQVLDSSNDPNGDIPAYEGVAYPTSPLSPNTTYSVSVIGTINGTAFSRTFTFTTGSIIG